MKWVWMVLLISCLGSWADSKDSEKSTSSPSSSKGSSVISIFDDKVFDIQPKRKGPGTQKGLGGNERYESQQGSGINYMQRKQIIEDCDAEKNISSAAFRKCYAKGVKNVKEGLERRRGVVEKRQKQPLSNVPAPMLRERQPDSSFGVQVEREYGKD